MAHPLYASNKPKRSLTVNTQLFYILRRIWNTFPHRQAAQDMSRNPSSYFHHYAYGSNSTHHHHYCNQDHSGYTDLTPGPALPTSPPPYLPGLPISQPFLGVIGSTPPYNMTPTTPDIPRPDRQNPPHLSTPNTLSPFAMTRLFASTSPSIVVEERSPSAYAHMGSDLIPPVPSGRQRLPSWFTSRTPGQGSQAAEEAHVGIIRSLDNVARSLTIHPPLNQWLTSDERMRAERRTVLKAKKKEEKRKGEYIRLRGEEKAWVRQKTYGGGKKVRKGRVGGRGEVVDVEWMDQDRVYPETGRVRKERWLRCL